jgi:Tol biopolymer transport system component
MPAVLALLGLITLLAVMASLSLVPLFAGADGPTGKALSSGLIAFDRDGDIYVTDPDPASEPRAIVSGPDEDVIPFWSPDGRHLLFIRYTPVGATPMLTDAAGAEPVALVDEPLGEPWSIEWTPRSDAVIVSSNLGTTALPSPGIEIVPVDGSGARIAVDAPGRSVDFLAPRPGSGETVELLYRSLEDPGVGQLRFAELTEDGAYLAGGTVLGVDDMAGVRATGNGHDGDFLNPTWAPAGDRFAFHTLNDVESAPNGTGFRVHVANFVADADPAGKDDRLVELDPLSDSEGWPVWSPDGSRLAFQAWDGNSSRLVIMPVPLEGPIDPSSAVVSEALSGSGPGSLGYAWSPEGDAVLLVHGDAAGGPAAYLVDASTGALQSLDWNVSQGASWQPSAG